MTRNKLECLPDSIGNLRKLEQLYLRHNRLRSIPPLHSCVAMKELYLGNNFIKVMFASMILWTSNQDRTRSHGPKLERIKLKKEIGWNWLSNKVVNEWN